MQSYLIYIYEDRFNPTPPIETWFVSWWSHPVDRHTRWQGCVPETLNREDKCNSFIGPDLNLDIQWKAAAGSSCRYRCRRTFNEEISSKDMSALISVSKRARYGTQARGIRTGAAVSYGINSKKPTHSALLFSMSLHCQNYRETHAYQGWKRGRHVIRQIIIIVIGGYVSSVPFIDRKKGCMMHACALCTIQGARQEVLQTTSSCT